jgi:HAMP domain-containing protein
MMINKDSLSTQKTSNSLLKRFRRATLWLYFVSLAVSIPMVYGITRYQVYAEAGKELSLLVDMIHSIRKYISDDVRPDLLKANIFHSPAVSSTVSAGKVAEYFHKLQPDYYIKNASDNPLNLRNKPYPLEELLLARYRTNGDIDTIVETGIIQAKKYLVSSRPTKAKGDCLLCHGNPNEAPLPIKTAYGTEHGYNYKVGEVVGLSTVGVPLADINVLVLQRSLFVAGILTILFAMIFWIVSGIVKRNVILPVISITHTATAISQGDLEREINIKRDGSEIGELAYAFELMKRSLAYSMRKSR